VVNEFTQAVSSLSLAAAGTPDAGAKAALAKAARMLRDFANIQRALQTPVTNDLIDLSEYLCIICSAIEQARLREKGIHLTFSGSPVPLEASRCWWAGLIVSELIENALKHGVEGDFGSISVAVAEGPDEIQCRVANSGRRAASFKPGRGSFIVAGLARELGGSVEIRSGQAATTVLLRLPRNGMQL
jgi:two-component sensor histidine kinase